MNKQLVDTVFYVTGKGELQSTEKNELEVLLKEHPYFAPAQLLLVAKLKKENSYNIKEQTQKASLFFNNSRWFQYQLDEVKLEESNFDYKGIEAATKTLEPIVEEHKSNVTTIPEFQIESISESLANPILEINIEKQEVEKKEVIHTYNEVFIPNFSIPTVEHVKDIFSGIDAKENVEKEFVDVVDKIDLIAAENNIVENEIVEENISEEIQEQKTEQVDLTKNMGIAAVKEEWEKPVDDLKDELLPFESEPYYTIDYFASQGIQFDFSKHPHDKLTTKMLKFTDWLKKMKGIKPENMVYEEDDELNKTIQNIAFNSNVSKEIVTETMAEVFAKQGKTEKAIQLYIKLSFLIPQKSSYFASKIQELKGI